MQTKVVKKSSGFHLFGPDDFTWSPSKELESRQFKWVDRGGSAGEIRADQG